MIEEFINRIKPDNILDFGCGDGSFDYKRFPSLCVTAIDKRIPEKANGFPSNVNFIKIDKITNETPLPLKKNTFDFVIMKFVLEHVENPIFFISEAERVLKNRGYFYVAIPNHKSLQDRLFRLATTIVGSKQGSHIQKFTFQNFLELIYKTTHFKLDFFLVTESDFTFMNHPMLKIFHNPWMKFMNFLERIGINLLANSDYIFLFELKTIIRDTLI